MSYQKIVALAGLLAVGLFSSCSQKTGAGVSAAVTANKTDRKLAPDFKLTDASGATVNLSDLRGKVVLLNFWATWCGPCELEIPWFIQFEQEFKSQGFEVVGVSMDDDGWTVVKPFIASHKMNYHVLLGNDSVSQLYGGIDSLPTTFILDRNGRIAYPPHIGLAGKNEYRNEIQSLLASSNKATRSLGDRMPPVFAAAVASATK